MGSTFKPALAAFAAVLTLALVAPVARADTIDISAGDYIRLYDGVGDPPGGEFDAVLQEKNASGDYVKASPAVEWSGFCLEVDESFSAGGLLKVADISDTAWNGGSNTNGGDPISYATAWLFTEFWNGTLDGLDDDGDEVEDGYTDNHSRNATHLQEAFWFLEEETLGVKNYYVTLAEEAVKDGWKTLGNVRVLNLERQNSSGEWINAQDQLVMVPVPEPSSLMLLGLGLAGAGFLRRRRRRLLDTA